MGDGLFCKERGKRRGKKENGKEKKGKTLENNEGMALLTNEKRDTMHKDSNLMRLFLLMLKFFDVLDKSLLVDLSAVSITRLPLLNVTYQTGVFAVPEHAYIAQAKLHEAFVHQIHR